MKYLADILTFSRMILAVVLGGLAIFGGSSDAAFVVFLAAELTDTFDGTCARKWPFPKNKTPKYRKYAALFDMVADALLAATQTLFVLIRVNVIVGIIVVMYYALCGVLELVIYGKFFGHPDNYEKNSLAAKNFPLAKKIILARRYGYTICLGVVNAFILFATSWATPIKIALFVFGCSIFVFIWFFLKQRRENISRDAVEIEKKLSKQK